MEQVASLLCGILADDTVFPVVRVVGEILEQGSYKEKFL
jgi:hypothetical protein